MRKGLKTFLLAAALLCASRSNAAPAQPKASQTRAVPPPELRIDINHATVDQLMKAPGMTHSWAERIVRFRPYRTKQDLIDHGVVTGEVYERIKDYIIAHREKQ